MHLSRFKSSLQLVREKSLPILKFYYLLQSFEFLEFYGSETISVSKLFTTSTFLHSIRFQNSSINHPRFVSVIPKFILEQQINSDLFPPKDQFHPFSHRNNVDDPLRNILSAAVYFQRCFVASSRSVSFGACRRVRIKGRRPHPRRAKSRLPWRLLSLSVPAITQ